MVGRHLSPPTNDTPVLTSTGLLFTGVYESLYVIEVFISGLGSFLAQTSKVSKRLEGAVKSLSIEVERRH